MFDVEDIDNHINEKEMELLVIRKSIEELIEENSKVEQDQKQYEERYSILEKNYYAVKRELDSLSQTKKDKETRLSAIKLFIAKFKEMPTFIDKFNSRIWNLVLDVAIVNKDKSITFVFKNKQKIIIPL